MAQDVRPYKSKEQDGQGNEIILRDQQLVEQTSQTTMASGEYFEIVDVDGRMAKIPKDNMISVVREALGSLLNGLADQTTVTKALTLNGDTLGASTAATLASVLGVAKVEHATIGGGESLNIGEIKFLRVDHRQNGGGNGLYLLDYSSVKTIQELTHMSVTMSGWNCILTNTANDPIVFYYDILSR